MQLDRDSLFTPPAPPLLASSPPLSNSRHPQPPQSKTRSTSVDPSFPLQQQPIASSSKWTLDSLPCYQRPSLTNRSNLKQSESDLGPPRLSFLPPNSPSAISHDAAPAAMASLRVVSPPTTYIPDPMSIASYSSSLPPSGGPSALIPLEQSEDCSARRASVTPPPPPCHQLASPHNPLLVSPISGSGWAMVSRGQHAHTATFSPESNNRRCVPASPDDSTVSHHVPFGQRPSPAIISFNQPASRNHSRSVSRNHTPPPLTAKLIDQSNHRGGLRGTDESSDGKNAQDSLSLPSHLQNGSSGVLTPLVPPPSRVLCIRHQRMADEGTTARLQKSIESLPLSDQTAVNTVWSLFSSSSHSRRALILQGILTMCCFSQLSLLSSELALAIRIDPFSLFPREISLKVLGHLDAISLGRTAQVSRLWRSLADDDHLWRNMCEQHIERKCEKCGWGLPLLSERRRRLPGPAVQLGTPESRDLTSGLSETTGSLKRTITAAANAAALEKQTRSRATSPLPSSKNLAFTSVTQSAQRPNLAEDSSSCSEQERDAPPSKKQKNSIKGNATPCQAGGAQPVVYKTKPWKFVYCERLAIERNWRRGRYTTRTLSGHTDGIMCLQFSENLTHPAFPVVITGSYDRTARIWNLETGEQLRVLEGHTRGVRCLQFDEAKLITGSMDRTLKIWNWRTGALMRTLEGHTEGIICLNFNQDTLASGSADSNVKVWNFRTGECYTLRGHRDWVNAVTLWTGPAAKQRLQQQLEAAKEGRVIKQDPCAAATFLFSASDDGTIRLWDLGLRECLLVFEGHVGQVQSLKLVMMDEESVKKLMAGAAGGPGAETVQRQELRRAANDDEDDDRDRLSLEDQESYFINDPNSANSIRQQQQQQAQNRLTTNNRSSTASQTIIPCNQNPTSASGSHSGSASNAEAPGIPDQFFCVTSTVSTSSSSLTATAQTRTTTSRQAQRAQQRHRRQRRIDPILARVQERLCEAGLVDPLPLDAEMKDIDVTFLQDDVQSGDEQLFDSSNGGQPFMQPSLSSSVLASAATATAGTGCRSKLYPLLVSGSLDNTLRIWDVRTGRCIRTLFGHVEGVWSLDVDKLRIVSASHDRTVKIWDRDTGYCQSTLVGHKGAVTCVSLGDDKIVSGSDDGDVRVWSFAANQQTVVVPFLQ